MSADTTATTSIEKALHWVATGLTAVVLAAMGAPNVMQAPAVMETYRLYLATILGVWNLPRRRSSRQPAAAQRARVCRCVVCLTGKAMSHGAVGDPVANILTPLVVRGIVGDLVALPPAHAAVVVSGSARQPV